MRIQRLPGLASALHVSTMRALLWVAVTVVAVCDICFDESTGKDGVFEFKGMQHPGDMAARIACCKQALNAEHHAVSVTEAQLERGGGCWSSLLSELDGEFHQEF